MERNSKGQLKDVIKQEYVKCAADPVYFLKKYCVIQHPIKGKIPFSLYNFQETTVEDFVQHRFNIIFHNLLLVFSNSLHEFLSATNLFITSSFNIDLSKISLTFFLTFSLQFEFNLQKLAPTLIS